MRVDDSKVLSWTWIDTCDETVLPEVLVTSEEATEIVCWIVVEGDCRSLHLSYDSLWRHICLWDLNVLCRPCTFKAE